jgi:hypothetical protein
MDGSPTGVESGECPIRQRATLAGQMSRNAQ